MTALEPAANWYGTRRHLSTTLETFRTGGREGRAICNGNVAVFDQGALDHYRRIWHRKVITVGDLPECKLCARKATAAGAR